MKYYKSAIAAAVLATGLALPALGYDVIILVPENAHSDVSYASGGVGDDEATAFKQAASQFPLELLFTRTGIPAEYLADVQVKITDKSGVVLDATANGPYFLAKLPPGRYQIAAAYRGDTKTQNVTIRSKQHSRMVFSWNGRDADSEVVGSTQ